jgi:hypothetical protein
MTKVNFYPNDDPDTAAKKLAKENDVWFTIPKGKDNDKKHEHFVQKCTVSDFIAEAVIVGGIPYFAVARSKSGDVTLEKSIALDDTSECKPFELSAYLNEPYDRGIQFRKRL